MQILNFGSLNIDTVYKVNHIVKAGETVSADTVEVHCGGKGLNQSIALARAGMQVMHAGMVGEDGQILIDMLKKASVDTRLIRMGQGKSGHSMIQISKTGENSIVLFGGTNRSISEEYMENILKEYASNNPRGLLLLQNEVNDVSEVLKKAGKYGLRIIMNPSPMDEEIKKADLSGVELFFLNEVEGEQMTGKKMPDEILRCIKEKYPASNIVLTLGECGSWFYDGNQFLKQEAIRTHAVDTTGAGDTFTGYFINEYFSTGDACKALRLAARAAGIAVTRMGAAESIPERYELEDDSIG